MFRRGDVVVMRDDYENRVDTPEFVGMLGVVQAVERTIQPSTSLVEVMWFHRGEMVEFYAYRLDKANA